MPCESTKSSYTGSSVTISQSEVQIKNLKKILSKGKGVPELGLSLSGKIAAAGAPPVEALLMVRSFNN